MLKLNFTNQKLNVFRENHVDSEVLQEGVQESSKCGRKETAKHSSTRADV